MMGIQVEANFGLVNAPLKVGARSGTRLFTRGTYSSSHQCV